MKNSSLRAGRVHGIIIHNMNYKRIIIHFIFVVPESSFRLNA